MSRVVVVNRTFGTRPIIIHAHGPMRHKPAWPRIRDAVFSPTAPDPARPAPRVTLVTCNNGHEAMGLFERSAERLRLAVRVFGGGVHPWVNSRDKPRVLHEALAAIETEYVLYADSRDAVIIGDPGDAVERMPAGCDLWLGGDRINWPALPRFRDYERALPGAADGEFRFLNGGAWIGRTAFCREVFAEAVRTAPLPEAPDSEQGILKTLFPRFHPRMRLDYRCEVFQNIGFVMEDAFDVFTEDAPADPALRSAPSPDR